MATSSCVRLRLHFMSLWITPCLCITLASSLIRKTLVETPQEFTVNGHKCKLTAEFDGWAGPKSYSFWIDDTLVTDLPPAPPIAKDGFPDVCQSEILEVKSDAMMHVTYNVFVKCLHSAIVLDHNRKSKITTLEVDGKIEKQWDGFTLEKALQLPYTFYIRE